VRSVCRTIRSIEAALGRDRERREETQRLAPASGVSRTRAPASPATRSRARALEGVHVLTAIEELAVATHQLDPAHPFGMMFV